LGGKTPNGSLLSSSALWQRGIILGLMLSAGAVSADDAFRFTAGAGVRYEDNVFRLPSSFDPQTYLGTSKKSDLIQTVNLGVNFDQTYSQQRFLVMAGVTDNRYNNFSHLSFVSKNYQAEWQWYLTSRLTGRLAADRQEALNDFRDYQGYSSRNIRTTDNRRFLADWWMQGSWHLIGGVVENRLENSQSSQAYAEASSRVRSVEAGAKYLTEANNFLSLLVRQGRGEYPGRDVDRVALLDNRFDQKELELSVGYQLTGKTTLNGRLARLEREHENLPVRDYSGTVGRLDFIWRPVPDLDINLSAGRDLVAFQATPSDPRGSYSYYANDFISLAPSWLVYAKTRLGAAFQHARRNYRGAVTPVDERNDRFNALGLTLAWMPTRTVTVSGTVGREKVTSNITAVGYTANTASVAVQATF
jgi:exopolysaccharide biosynthesis operon protein EpsL